MTLGSVEGEPNVPAVPASPVLATTVTPAATAASSARAMGSLALSGMGLPPNDSLMTSAPWSTAYSMACTKLELNVTLFWAEALSAITDAPGAMPRMVMKQGMGAWCRGIIYDVTS